MKAYKIFQICTNIEKKLSSFSGSLLCVAVFQTPFATLSILLYAYYYYFFLFVSPNSNC